MSNSESQDYSDESESLHSDEESSVDPGEGSEEEGSFEGSFEESGEPYYSDEEDEEDSPVKMPEPLPMVKLEERKSVPAVKPIPVDVAKPPALGKPLGLPKPIPLIRKPLARANMSEADASEIAEKAIFRRPGEPLDFTNHRRNIYAYLLVNRKSVTLEDAEDVSDIVSNMIRLGSTYNSQHYQEMIELVKKGGYNV